MLKAYAVALLLSSSTPVNADTQESVRPLERQQTEASTELHRPHPMRCKICGIRN